MIKGREVVCDRCFKDKRLREYIREKNTRGDCPWCGARSAYVVPLAELGDLFRDVADIYEPVEGFAGDDIAFLLQEDWEVFGEQIEEGGLAQDMAVAILDAGLDPKDRVDYPDYTMGFRMKEAWLEEHWHQKAEAFLSGKGSYAAATGIAVPDEGGEVDLFPDQLEIAFEDLSTLYEPGKVLYRARIHKNRYRREIFTPDEMGAPPPEKTLDARANRVGEPVLYLSSDADTALCEVRAWKGAAVALARMRVQRQVSIVNLLESVTVESPFFEEFLAWKVELAALFHRLAEELSRPVMPHEEKDLYRSTQYLCDCIKEAGYGGVAFPSSMGLGFNVVTFDSQAAQPIDVKYVRVNEIRVRFKELGEHEDIYEEGPYDYLYEKSRG